MKKNALFVFNGNPMCFIHVLLNALDMDDKGMAVSIIIEGEAVKLLTDIASVENALHVLWEKAINQNLIAGVCLACAKKLGTIDTAKQMGLPLLDDMNGHAGMGAFQEQGYNIITF